MRRYSVMLGDFLRPANSLATLDMPLKRAQLLLRSKVVGGLPMVLVPYKALLSEWKALLCFPRCPTHYVS